jgi:hypothetical protein
MKKNGQYFTRRELLKNAARMGIAGTMLPLGGFASTNPQKRGLIIDENKLPGTTDWQTTYVKSKSTDPN